MPVKLFSAVLAFLLLLPLSVQAQGPPTMGTSFWNCNAGYIGDLVQEMTDVGLPIAQEMVDDGTIVTWGMMTHVFGDEWNVMFYVATPDGTPFMDTAAALQGAHFAALGDESNARFLENCSEHKDSIYTWDLATQGGVPGDDPMMVVSYWKCNYAYVGDLVEGVAETGLPVAQQMVDDGDLFAYGMMTHAWGDEWNVMFYTATHDEASFMQKTSDLQSEQFEAMGSDMIAGFLENCHDHRDNIYSMRVHTTPRIE